MVQPPHSSARIPPLADAWKIPIVPTRGLINQRDLALACSPGVGAACKAIARDGTGRRWW
ncbi:MAG: hypothetical protein HY323_11345 [Betaproteobacteria bacterium]|nr:hypothetical protein [Betaproteobacteria bacterium]